MQEQKEVIKHVTPDELKKLVRKEKDKHVFERLLFIKQLYIGDTVQEACERLCIAEQTGYNWLDLWNEHGYDGIAPDFGGGRPSKLTEEQKEQLKEKLKSNACWLTTEVRNLIIRDFGIVYSLRQISRVLAGFGMHYAKPYLHDYRKPDNAEGLLKQAIENVIGKLPGNSVIGFFDESSPQTTDNRQRFWSFGKPEMTRNTKKYRANTFGFYPVNGNAAVDITENSRICTIRDFLRTIRDRNPGRHILLFLDNFCSHASKHTLAFAESIGITLVFIPKYSPDLNPIEFIWKAVRRRLSQIRSIESEWAFGEAVRTAFCRLARKMSFMEGWLEKFGPCLSKVLCQ